MFLTWLFGWTNRKSGGLNRVARPGAVPKRSTFRPMLEQLEERTLPSATPCAAAMLPSPQATQAQVRTLDGPTQQNTTPSSNCSCQSKGQRELSASMVAGFMHGSQPMNPQGQGGLDAPKGCGTSTPQGKPGNGNPPAPQQNQKGPQQGATGQRNGNPPASQQNQKGPQQGASPQGCKTPALQQNQKGPQSPTPNATRPAQSNAPRATNQTAPKPACDCHPAPSQGNKGPVTQTPGKPPANNGTPTTPGNNGSQSNKGSDGGNVGQHGNNGNSQQHGNNGVGNGVDPQPPGNPPVNDGAGTGPGNPGNRKSK